MARLSSMTRNSLPSSAFAGPNRSFPIPNKSHAVAAKAMVGRAQKKGTINATQANVIRRKANAKLGQPDASAVAMAKQKIGGL